MQPFIAFLFFDGNCSEALEFYKESFGGELSLMTYADAPEEQRPQGVDTSQIMYGELLNKKGEILLMAADNPRGAPTVGDNIQLHITCEFREEIQSLFQALAKGGSVKQDLQDVFWGAHFGMLVDQFGIHWMLTYKREEE